MNIKGSDEKLFGAITCLLELTRVLDIPFTIKHAYKHYHFAIKSATVIVYMKSFTNKGEDCLYLSLADACKWLIKTHEQFSKYKKILDKTEAEQNIMCKYSVFEIISAKKQN